MTDFLAVQTFSYSGSTISICNINECFQYCLAQSARAVEYTDCTCTGGVKIHPHYEYPGYDTEQSVHDVPQML